MIDGYLINLYNGIDKKESLDKIRMYVRMLEQHILCDGEVLDFIQQEFVNVYETPCITK